MSRILSTISVHSIADESVIDMKDIFPKKLPELHVGPVYDDNGFTLSERLALRQAWKVIKPFERRYGKEIYFTFLMENYKVFENFRWKGKLDLQRLHGHSLNFMRFLCAVIDQNDPVVFQAMLNDMYNMHNRCHVNFEYMEILVKALISYVLDKLHDVRSASLQSGFQKLLDKFHTFVIDDRPKGITYSIRPSDDIDVC
ncbi:uncharacterized protein LOC127566162 [Drosophila albomicans]|uniref:Uncharacterized protein LOC127566162 n=1 Tax=Drosophila albomicans TaxID=7291 RepID=A0A9C6WIP0_DROAB|nr:uncharacterized protein LOC127566162 [Drosophila albomicans]